VRLHAQQYGKGPTRARSYLFSDLLACVMRDTMTRAEEILLRSGQDERVHALRQSLDDAMRDDCCRIVTELTGRRVLSFFSKLDVSTDVAVKVFLLEADRNAEVPVLDRDA
jgi:uncharacterized protein YbcI